MVHEEAGVEHRHAARRSPRRRRRIRRVPTRTPGSQTVRCPRMRRRAVLRRRRREFERRSPAFRMELRPEHEDVEIAGEPAETAKSSVGLLLGREDVHLRRRHQRERADGEVRGAERDLRAEDRRMVPRTDAALSESGDEGPDKQKRIIPRRRYGVSFFFQQRPDGADDRKRSTYRDREQLERIDEIHQDGGVAQRHSNGWHFRKSDARVCTNPVKKRAGQNFINQLKK